MKSTLSTWKSMVRRCRGPSSNFKYYGGRGISVCERWSVFANFVEDMGDRPSGCTLDRIDKDGDYKKANCRWATPKEQGRNKSNNSDLEFNGERLCIAAWSERLGIDRGTIRKRMSKGWPPEEVFRGKSAKHHVTGRKTTQEQQS